MAGPRLIKGFDYRLGKEVEKPRVEWRDQCAEDCKKGARRRVENGETFIHDPKTAAILYEIYTNIPARATDPGDP